MPTEKLALANKKPGARILKLGDQTISPQEYVFDRSFPRSTGHPNPHLWMNPLYAARYAELVRDAVTTLDPTHATVYQQRTRLFTQRLHELDRAIATAIGTIPPKHRKLLTYHDSFAYFAPRYGMTVIGAIEPASFAEPSPWEVARVIRQLKQEKLPAVFGSEVFPSKVLDQIAREAGVQFVATLRDDDLPGAPGSPQHSYIGMMLENVRTMATALGGRADALQEHRCCRYPLICLAAGLTVAPDETVKAVGLVMHRRSDGHHPLWQCVILPQHSSLPTSPP